MLQKDFTNKNEMEMQRIEINSVKRSDFTMSILDFDASDMGYSPALDYPTSYFQMGIFYKGKHVDSVACYYCDVTGQTCKLNENESICGFLLDKQFKDQVLCYYMNKALSSRYKHFSSWRPDDRISMAFEGLYCAFYQTDDSFFLIYDHDKESLAKLSFEEAEAKRPSDDAYLMDEMFYISDKNSVNKEEWPI